MNEKSIYIIQGANAPLNIGDEFLRNYFDSDRGNSIDFENIEQNVYAYVDTKAREIAWILPVKVNNVSQETNNFVIVYDIDLKSFKTRRYYKDIFLVSEVDDISNTDKYYLMTDYEGNIYKLSKNKNDFNKPIKWTLATNGFDDGSAFIGKRIKVLRLNGRNLENIHFHYWMDGQRKRGSIQLNRDYALCPVYGSKIDRDLRIEVSGEDLNEKPAEIHELMIGYENLRSLVR